MGGRSGSRNGGSQAAVAKTNSATTNAMQPQRATFTGRPRFHPNGLNASSPNIMYYGDNFNIMRDHIGDECIDLVYADPPFNSSREYNIIFRDGTGKEALSQVSAFNDTWTWSERPDDLYQGLVFGDYQSTEKVTSIVVALQQFLKPGPLLAYLVNMTARLVEIHRVLKPTGSFWLHCDTTASHYLKIVLDAIFGDDQFRGEIVWKRTSSHNAARRPGPVHDVLLFYSKTDNYVWNQQYQPYDESYIKDFYRHSDSDGRRYTLSDLTGAGTRNGETGRAWRGIDINARGRHWSVPPDELDKLDAAGRIYWPANGGMPRYKRYLDEMQGIPVLDVWLDISPLGAQAAERLGYPTQKPVALLERIIKLCSNPGDVVMDPYCGCGTAIAGAHKLDRIWVGIDITHLAVTVQKQRLSDTFGLKPKIDYNVYGEPVDVGGAANLAKEDAYQFQWWALSLVGAVPLGGQAPNSKVGKKGSDKGIDGFINFNDDRSGKPKKVLIQVKSGNVQSGDIRDLVGTIGREGAAIGVFITLKKPSQEMITEALSAGYYHCEFNGVNYRRMQILTIEELLEQGKRILMPRADLMFKKADWQDREQQAVMNLQHG
jgi:site-specific DNA-methyltransferase (adenine-specific)